MTSSRAAIYREENKTMSHIENKTLNVDPSSMPPEAYLAWIRTTIENQDNVLNQLMAPLLGSDMDVAVSEQWLEDLAAVAGAFVEPDPDQVSPMNMTFRA